MGGDNDYTHAAAATGEHDAKEKQQIELLLEFFASTKNYCVGIVDMVGSTATTMKMPSEKASRYYSIFLNGMAGVVARHGGVVVKNAGDSLLYYFPGTEQGNAGAFRDVLKCCFAMAAAGPELDSQMQKEGLPPVRYRISCEYGSVMVAKMSTSSVNDIFGTSVNLCSKMNVLARPGDVVIGEGLYQKVRDFPEYEFAEVKGTQLFADNEYKIYSVALRR
ncbi:MAG: adenylate/guanylate cyclase domain-containing protein [Nitrososphaera sp.]